MKPHPKSIALAAMEARARGEKRRRVLAHGQPHDPHIGEPVTRPRKPSEDPKPFCWASCAAWRTIERGFEDGGLAMARAVYSTLCQIAAEQNAEVFPYPQRDLAARAGVSVRALRDIIHKLESLELVTFYHTAAPDTRSMGENIYRLLSTKRASDGQAYIYGKDGDPIPPPPPAPYAGGAAPYAGGSGTVCRPYR